MQPNPTKHGNQMTIFVTKIDHDQHDHDQYAYKGLKITPHSSC